MTLPNAEETTIDHRIVFFITRMRWQEDLLIQINNFLQFVWYLHCPQRRHVGTTGVSNWNFPNKRFNAPCKQTRYLSDNFSSVFYSDTKLEHLPMYQGVLVWIGLTKNMRTFKMTPTRLVIF
jgi:hypothetical protein